MKLLNWWCLTSPAQEADEWCQTFLQAWGSPLAQSGAQCSSSQGLTQVCSNGSQAQSSTTQKWPSGPQSQCTGSVLAGPFLFVCIVPARAIATATMVMCVPILQEAATSWWAHFPEVRVRSAPSTCGYPEGNGRKMGACMIPSKWRSTWRSPNTEAAFQPPSWKSPCLEMGSQSQAANLLSGWDPCEQKGRGTKPAHSDNSAAQEWPSWGWLHMASLEPFPCGWIGPWLEPGMWEWSLIPLHRTDLGLICLHGHLAAKGWWW